MDSTLKAAVCKSTGEIGLVTHCPCKFSRFLSPSPGPGKTKAFLRRSSSAQRPAPLVSLSNGPITFQVARLTSDLAENLHSYRLLEVHL